MKKIINVLIIALVLVMSLRPIVMASTLNLEVTSNKEKVDVDEEIVVTIDWKEGMQAADFILNYDDKKFEFVSINLEDIFYKVEKSKVKIAWVSLDDTDKTSIDVTLKALKPGKADFSTEISGGFATGELVSPDNYNTGSTTVKINGFIIEYITPIVIAVVVIIIIIALITTKKAKSRKK